MPAKNDKPTTAKRNKIRAWLEGKGYTTSEANSLAKTTATLEQIEKTLIADLRGRKLKK